MACAAPGTVPARTAGGFHPNQLAKTDVDRFAVDVREQGLEFFLEALISLRKGEFTVRLPNDWVGLRGKVADTFNDVLDMNDFLKQLDSSFNRLFRANPAH